MKLDFAFSACPGLRSGGHPGVGRGPALKFLFWISAFAGMTEEVTQSFFLDQTGSRRQRRRSYETRFYTPDGLPLRARAAYW